MEQISNMQTRDTVHAREILQPECVVSHLRKSSASVLAKHDHKHRSDRVVCIDHCLVQFAVHPVKHNLNTMYNQTMTARDTHKKLTDCLPTRHDFTCANAVTL